MSFDFQHFRQLLAGLPIAAYTCDPDGLITYYNDAAVELWRRAPKLNDPSERFSGSFARYAPDGTSIAREDGWMARALRSRADQLGHELLIERADGSIATVLANARPILDGQGTLLGGVNVLIDITERKRAEADRRALEARVQHAQRLESLGVLAGGIAHDFNNLLTSVLGYASLAQRDLPADSPTRPMLEEIRKAAGRAAELTREMLAYTGRGKFVTRQLLLDEVVRETRVLLQTVVSKKSSIVTRLERAPIDGDSAQIRQIVMNLITNASDALEDRPGRIGIRTGRSWMQGVALCSPHLREEFPDGEYSWLEVEDDGCGMDEATLARMFDPFFTTKFAGRGLGLAAVLGIVRGHHGSLHVRSRPGAGTKFTVLFPAVELAPSAAPEPAALEDTHSPRGSGTVLVVDDEENVRSFVRRVLESAGFLVVVASNGAEGVHEFAARAGELHAAIVDLTMPKMDGWEALTRMQSTRADVPLFLMSGFGEAYPPARFAQTRVAGYLEKPFEPRELIARICGIQPRPSSPPA